MIKIKKVFQNLYNWLHSEPENLHPRLKVIPNVILNILGLLFYILLAFGVVSFLVKKLIN